VLAGTAATATAIAAAASTCILATVASTCILATIAIAVHLGKAQLYSTKCVFHSRAEYFRVLLLVHSNLLCSLCCCHRGLALEVVVCDPTEQRDDDELCQCGHLALQTIVTPWRSR
jgi:hypothetical protein